MIVAYVEGEEVSPAIVPWSKSSGNGWLLGTVRRGNAPRACPSRGGFPEDQELVCLVWSDQRDGGIQIETFEYTVEALLYFKSALPTTICVVLYKGEAEKFCSGNVHA